ncbi:signal peptidase I [Aneurinibacillus tyrosinisolvens]|uniref:signal peptidase I n=1 Tax=Aneurinibacillus tyrosinisolvens TaxID=1443435 RepID=UPI00063EE1D5|nr:signal peptidase I [Aneurinibacillus tyrosinisolvens]
MGAIKEVVSWVRAMAIVACISILVGVFLFQPSKVLGYSMQPTLKDEQRIYVSKLTHTLHLEPHYGDIVIIDSRVNRERTLKDDFLDNPLISLITNQYSDEMWIKRVIGKPGDILQFKDNKVYRNGAALTEPYIKETMEYVSAERVVVPKDAVFVMGDNRNNSSDSRYIGCVPLDHVLGTKLF